VPEEIIHVPNYDGPERRHPQHGRHGRRRYDLPPWVTIIIALLAAIQPIIIGLAVILRA
jgi:hypothetical protein